MSNLVSSVVGWVRKEGGKVEGEVKVGVSEREG
jgi:hypothetical protein